VNQSSFYGASVCFVGLRRSLGEVPKAFVVLRTAAAAEELMEFVAGRVANFDPSGTISRRVAPEFSETDVCWMSR
jgi:hypothetical protein